MCGFKSRALKCLFASGSTSCHTTCHSEVPCMPWVTSVSQLGSSCSSVQLLAPLPKDWMPPSVSNMCERKVSALNLIAFTDWIPLILSILDCSGSDLRRKGVRINSGILSCGKVFLRGHLCPSSPASEDITKLLKWQRSEARGSFSK